jgi:hypothetical protein
MGCHPILLQAGPATWCRAARPSASTPDAARPEIARFLAGSLHFRWWEEVDMRPTEVRSRVLADHSALRMRLSSLANLSRDVLEGCRGGRGDLRAEALDLLETLAEHMYWEDRYLAPALRRADAWGEERASRLAEDHREQRALLEYLVRGLEDRERPSLLLARNVDDLVKLLLDDMDGEEASLLDPRVLRDDVVGIDVETG